MSAPPHSSGSGTLSTLAGLPWKEVALTGWGRLAGARCWAARPERIGELGQALALRGTSCLAYGGGRSYGDAALNHGGRALMTSRLDRILAFDEATGEVVLEPGVTFRDLLEVFLPRGFVVPVSPGTAYATIGGAVANDVHGKNHEVVGSLGAHLRWIELLLPSGEITRASSTERAELFRLVLGGIGLGAIILAVCLRLARVPSNALRLEERRLGDLDGMLAALAERRTEMPYSVAWLDALAGGRSLGRGVLESAGPSDQPIAFKPRPRFRFPFDAPGFVLSSWSVRAFNEVYWRRIPRSGRRRPVDYERFLYPLDSLLDWNRLYGKRGFRQFQCALPPDEAAAALRKLLEEIGRARNASFLAVLKSLGASGQGMLSFPRPGYTIALDVPERPGSAELFARLERITRDHGGRVYLAKDSSLSPEGFAEMYPALPRVRALLELLDPERRIESDMARRLRIRGDGADP